MNAISVKKNWGDNDKITIKTAEILTLKPVLVRPEYFFLDKSHKLATLGFHLKSPLNSLQISLEAELGLNVGTD